MKKLMLILFLIPVMFNVFSQDDSPTETEKKPTLSDIQRNSVSVDYSVVFLSALYERTIPFGNKTGIIVGAGISQGVAFTSATNPVVKIVFLLGRYKHFFEGGIAIAPLGNDVSIFNPLVGYRYQSTGGFFFRVGVTLVSDKDTHNDTGEESIDLFPAPGLTLGYSF